MAKKATKGLSADQKKLEKIIATKKVTMHQAQSMVKK